MVLVLTAFFVFSFFIPSTWSMRLLTVTSAIPMETSWLSTDPDRMRKGRLSDGASRCQELVA